MELVRIPSTTNNSLKCWNSADEYLINYVESIDIVGMDILILGDRFGYLSKQVLLKGGIPKVYIDLKSQEESIKQNCGEIFTFKSKDEIPKSDLCLTNIPKSISELELFLDIISHSLDKEGTALFGFMTRHFTVGYVKSIEEHFNDVQQSKAKKKSRLIIAKSMVNNRKVPIQIELEYSSSENLSQLQGVFSEKKIDYATKYLLNHLEVKESEKSILDLGSGNGVIAYHIHKFFRNKKITLLDNSFRAHLSGKSNIEGSDIEHIWNYNLSEFEEDSFDLIVTNPPFHFNFEVDLSIPFNLLQECKTKLREGGRLVLVANKHINYKSALLDHFKDLEIISENNKYFILQAIK